MILFTGASGGAARLLDVVALSPWWVSGVGDPQVSLNEESR